MKPPSASTSFPKNFVWGVATAAPQIEGAAFEDGKGPSVWDAFARRPGTIRDGSNLDVSCDHYHRFPEDFALMAELGVKNYRLSIAWPRIFPTGRGAVNPKGLDFYHRLLDAMIERGITPWVTMFHWDLPQALEEKGGWCARATADAFATYADTLVKAYGDRVRHWITVNEIHCFTKLAYGGWGDKAPGLDKGPAAVNASYHHALLAHGHGVRAVREHGRRGSLVGFADNTQLAVPFTETPDDIAAARAYYIDQQIQTQDPIFQGRYSELFRRRAGKHFPKVLKDDFALISAPTDFLGQNIYSAEVVRAPRVRGAADYEQIQFPPRYFAADASWIRVVPRALYWGARFATELHGVKNIYFTENGSGWFDSDPAGGEVNDLHRLELARLCLGEVRRAIADGAPIRGYFHWSFLDNFEWASGYTERFGLVHVDYKTQRRTPKLSARWYSQVMRENRIV
jgi:beta-glucosidase